MPETFRPPLSTDAERHEESSDHDHRRAARKWSTHEELPRARLYPAALQAVSWHQPLNDPAWTDAYDHLRDDDPVLGLYLGRRAWALPWWIIKNHHVANQHACPRRRERSERPSLSAGDISADRPGAERLARRRGNRREMPARDAAGAR